MLEGAKRTTLFGSERRRCRTARVLTFPGTRQQCVDKFRAKAKEFREVFGDEGRARTLEWAARKVEQALRDENEDLLTLAEAAQASGYHPDSLARMVRDGQIPDLRPSGSKGMIRIRRGDLPIKPGKPHTPSADVRELASRLGIRGTGGPHGHP